MSAPLSPPDAIRRVSINESVQQRSYVTSGPTGFARNKSFSGLVRSVSELAPLSPEQADAASIVAALARERLRAIEIGEFKERSLLPGELLRLSPALQKTISVIREFFKGVLKPSQSSSATYITQADADRLDKTAYVPPEHLMEALRTQSGHQAREYASGAGAAIGPVADFVKDFNADSLGRPDMRARAKDVLRAVKYLVWPPGRKEPRIENISTARSACMKLWDCDDAEVRLQSAELLIRLLEDGQVAVNEEGQMAINVTQGLLTLLDDLQDALAINKAQNLSVHDLRALMRSYASCLTAVLMHTGTGGDLGTVTFQRKQKLKETAELIEKLNGNNDDEIAFWQDFALEASKRLDAGGNDGLISALCHIAGAAVKVASIVASPASATTALFGIFSDIKALFLQTDFKQDWYEVLVTIARIGSLALQEGSSFSFFAERCQSYMDDSRDPKLRYGIVIIIERIIKKAATEKIKEDGLKLLMQLMQANDPYVQKRCVHALGLFMDAEPPLRYTASVLIRMMAACQEPSTQEGQAAVARLLRTAERILSPLSETLSSDQCHRSVLMTFTLQLIGVKGDHEMGGSQIVTAIAEISQNAMQKPQNAAALLKLIPQIFGAEKVTDVYDNTPITHAAKKGNVELLGLLATSWGHVDANIASKDEGNTALHYATSRAVVQKLRGMGAVFSANGVGNWPLHAAAIDGDAERIRMLIEAGHPIDAKTFDGKTALDLACTRDSVEVIRLLQTAGCPSRLSVLSLVAESGSEQVLETLLLLSGNTPKPADAARILRRISSDGAHQSCSDEFARFHIERCHNNSAYNDAFKPFKNCPHPVEERGRIHLEKPVAARGAVHEALARDTRLSLSREDMNEKDGLGSTVLMACARDGRLKRQLQDCLQAGVAVDTTDHLGYTALQMAAMVQNEEAYEVLLKAGADPFAPNSEGLCALHYVAANWNRSMLLATLPLYGKRYSRKDDVYGLLPVLCGTKIIKEWRQDLNLALPSRRGTRAEFLTSLFKIIDYGSEDSLGRSALHYVSLSGDVQAARVVLKTHPDLVWRQDKTGQTPLDCVVAVRDENMARVLLTDCPKKDWKEFAAKCAGSKSLGVLLASLGFVDLLEKLIQEDRDAAYTKPTTPLHAAAKEGNTAVLELYIKMGLSLVEKDSDGNTAAHVAALHLQAGFLQIAGGYPEMLETPNADYRSPLHLACLRDSEDGVVAIIDSGLCLRSQDAFGFTALHSAVYKGHSAIVRRLLAVSKPLVAATTETNRTALHIAAAKGYVEIAKILLEAGSDKDARDAKGLTPLMVAAQEGKSDVVRLLQAAAVDTRARDYTGKSALHLAAAGGHHEVCAALLAPQLREPRKKNDLLLLQDNDGKYPVHALAEGAGTADLCQVFQEAGASLMVADKTGDSPLHLAIRSQNIAVANFLVGVVASRGDVANNKGQRPMHVAAEVGSVAMLQNLRRAGYAQACADKMGLMPLQVAAVSGQRDCVHDLVLNGSSLQVRTTSHVPQTEPKKKL